MSPKDKTSKATSTAPLLKEIRKRHKDPSWFHQHISVPFSKFSLIEFIFVRKVKPSPPRSIYINQPLPPEFYDDKHRLMKSRKYHTNQNVTSKYTILTFIPRNLMEQFRRVANCFFLFINILQFFPQFSTINPGLVFLPLIAVLAITALKDGYEDVKRHQADRNVNNSIVHILAGDGYKNHNVMKGKSKTFVPAIPIPSFKSKKQLAKEAAKAAEMVKDTYRRESQVLQNETMDQLDSDDSGEPRPAVLKRATTQHSTWAEDPDAGDAPKELGWHRAKWEDLKVGDLVKIYDNEQFPADIVILATSEDEDVCYIETKNLDGETNLKSRHAVTGLSHLTSSRACSNAHLRIDLDAPEVNMYKLNGAVINEDETGHDGQPAIHPVSLETSLLRGCVLKNTAWIVGVVMYTGHDTKIIQNSGITPSKRSKVERQMDPFVLANLAILAIAAMVCAVVNYFNELRWIAGGSYWTLYAGTLGYSASTNGILTFFNAFITFQNIVPISLYISIEFVRTIQAAFVYWDRSIKYVKNGVTTRTLARTWNLTDDLGQIEYVFSDKTGTLTQNAMIFRQCSVGGKIYSGDGQIPENTITKKGSSSESDSSTAGGKQKNDDIKVQLAKEVLAPFHDSQLDKDLEQHDSEQSRLLHGFFAVLGLCHTVLAAEPEPGVIEYKAQSPDEAALVQSAADVGFIFRGRDKNIMKLQTPFSDEPDEYELLHVLEFSSARKRMSVILRKMDDGRLFLLSKGADSVIFERLAKNKDAQEIKEKTDQDLQFFASEGLRTLCLAYRVLEVKEYEQWARDYHQATVAMDERDEKIEEVSSRLEQGLILLGATAIEDKLQDGVPETISDLKRAGIKVWVATGDKLETAVAIGYTTHLLTNETNLIIVREGSHVVKDQILDALENFFGESDEPRNSMQSTERPGIHHRMSTENRSLVGDNNGHRPGGYSLVIDGAALTHAFNDPETSDLLLALSTRCITVICCRVSPLQKAQIVRLIKDNLGVMCLAIGDGANDVSMIQAADVGVGISGEEGLQAVNSSDYAIAQFRYLARLLFLHGQWSYFRNSSMILNFFYKNIIGVGVLWWFQPFCGFSTTYVFSYTYLLFWNVFWTLVPVLAIGIFDRNIDQQVLMDIPEIYKNGRRSKWFGFPRFTYYMIEGIVQSAIIYYILNYTYVTTSTRGDGFDVYIYEMSTTMAIGAVMVANLFTGLNIFTWVAWTYAGIFLGPVLIWVYTAVFSAIKPSSFYTGVYGNYYLLFRSAAFWFGWPWVIVICLLPRYLIKYMVQNYYPNDIDIMRLIRKNNPEIDPRTDPELGGKLRETDGEISPSEVIAQKKDGDIPMVDNPGKVESGYRQEPDQPRPSLNSTRYGANGSARGSQVDMSTGITREASRGFDFTSEEGGVAVARMQSRLSQTSSHHKLKFSNIGGTPHKNPFAITKIRERAGSVFSPKKRRDTNASAPHPVEGADEGHTAPSTPGLGGDADNKAIGGNTLKGRKGNYLTPDLGGNEGKSPSLIRKLSGAGKSPKPTQMEEPLPVPPSPVPKSSRRGGSEVGGEPPRRSEQQGGSGKKDKDDGEDKGLSGTGYAPPEEPRV